MPRAQKARFFAARFLNSLQLALAEGTTSVDGHGHISPFHRMLEPRSTDFAGCEFLV